MSKKAKTLVLGASTNPSRYSYRAVLRLLSKGIEVVPVGIKSGRIGDVDILTGMPAVKDVHTVTLYLNPERQIPYYDYILGLNPKRIIFNPGTENVDLIRMAKSQGIDPDISCTLVLLAMDNY